MSDRENFAGPEQGYIVATWNEQAARWQFRAVTGGPLLSDDEIHALGLDAALEGIEKQAPLAYSQRDSRWAGIRLDGSNYTMGGAGCAVTACAMVASSVEPAITPLELVTWLNANGGFTSGGLLYWAKVAQFVDGLTFVDYHLWRKVAADIEKLKAALRVGPQVVQVDFKPATSTLDTHFVTALSMTEDGKDVNIIDPWTGEHTTLLIAYSEQGWTLARAIYALAEFGYM